MLIYRNRAQAILFEYAYNMLNRNELVLLPTNTCESVIMSYEKIGIPYELIDADINTMSMDLNLVEDLLVSSSNRYQAIHYVYNYGYSDEIIKEKLQKIKLRFGIKIIEDRCLCEPDVSFDEFKDIWSDLRVFSTGRCKYCDIGYGGYAYVNTGLTQNPNLTLSYKEEDYLLAKKVLSNEVHGVWKDACKLEWLDIKKIENVDLYQNRVIEQYNKVKKHKNELNNIYDQMIPLEMRLHNGHCVWRYNIKLSNARFVQNLIMKEDGLFVSRHYKSWGKGVFSEKYYPNAELINNCVLNLFNDFYYDQEKARRTAEIIKEFGKI